MAGVASSWLRTKGTSPTIAHASGNSKVIDIPSLDGQQILALRSWGKHFLIQLPERALRVHFMMFGSYRINERKETPPRLSLQFENGEELNFYACSVREIGASVPPIDVGELLGIGTSRMG